MIVEAFRALNAMMVRRRLKDGDIEIVIRCRNHEVEAHILHQMDEELLFRGRGFVIATDEMLNGDHLRSGTISGVHFRLEVMK